MSRKEEGREDASHKFGDYLIDISKYVLTAVLITMFFNDLSSSKWLTYSIGSAVAVASLIWGINFYKNKECPTLKYTEDYPLSLNINEEIIINQTVVDEFQSFCEENKKNKIEFNKIEELYYDCTSAQVAEKIYSELKV